MNKKTKGTLCSLKSNLFFIIWAPSFISFISIGIVVFSLNLWIAKTPEGGSLLGITVGVASLVSALVTLLISGVIDRTNKYMLLIKILLGLVVCFVFLWIIYLFEISILPIIAIVVMIYVVIECYLSLYFATLETVLVDESPKQWVSSKTATLINLQPQVERLVGPLIGGLISTIMYQHIPVLSIIGITIVVIGLRYTERLSHPTELDTKRDHDSIQVISHLRIFSKDIKMALQWIRKKPILIYMLVIGICGNFIVFPFYSLLPAFLMTRNIDHHQLASLYGQMASAYGLGMLFTSTLIIRYVKRVNHPEKVALILMFLIILVMLGISWIHSFKILLLLMVLLGAFFIILVSVGNGTWLEATPSDIRVRIFSLRRLVAFSSIPIGSSMMGFLGSAIGYDLYLRLLLMFIVCILTFNYFYFKSNSSKL
jgi:MFS family permease